MGNRAVVTMSTRENAPCIYMHWNGGKATILGFLEAAKIVGLSGRNEDERIINLATMIDKAFEGKVANLHLYGHTDRDNHDNGVYRIDEEWDIVERLHVRHPEQIDIHRTNEVRHAAITNYNQGESK